MFDNKFITEAQYREAVNVPMPSVPHLRKYEAPYFIEILRQQLEAKLGNELYTSGYKIMSTIDSRMQQIAEEEVRRRHSRSREEDFSRGGSSSGCN